MGVGCTGGRSTTVARLWGVCTQRPVLHASPGHVHRTYTGLFGVYQHVLLSVDACTGPLETRLYWVSVCIYRYITRRHGKGKKCSTGLSQMNRGRGLRYLTGETSACTFAPFSSFLLHHSVFAYCCLAEDAVVPRTDLPSPM